jgi:integrase
VARRSNGEGTIYRRADGRWCTMVTLEDGRRKVIYTRSRQSASEKLKDALQARTAGVLVSDERQTVGQYLAEWLAETAKPTIRVSTYTSYESIVRLHLIPTIGRVPVRKLTPQQVQRLLNDKHRAGLKPKRIHAALRAALNDAVKFGIVPRNVAALVTPPRVADYEIEPFSPDQVRTLLFGLKGNRLEALYSVAVAMGVRQGEALGLRWEDVDFSAGTLRVRYGLQRIKGKFDLVETKTRKSRRTLYMPAVTLVALREHRTRQLEERLAFGPDWARTDLVFTTPVGTPIDASNLRHSFYRLLKAIGLPQRRFHDLRHSCATLLLVQGVPARVVMETLGHSQITLTLNTYSHVPSELQREAATRMNDLLSERRPDASRER